MEIDGSATDERARRVRSLLSSYYGNAEDDSHLKRWDRESRSLNYDRESPQIENIDSRNFDHDLFVNNLVSESSLEDLLEKHLSWSAEIKNLDGDMQMLVYENYNKFIAATDTISRMKEDVSIIEADVEKLSVILSQLQSQSDKVSSSLGGRREKIEELNGTRGLLEKVQFVFDLPKRLEGYIAKKDYSSAVKAYVGSLPILESSYGEASFLSCKEECTLIIERLLVTLKDNVLSEEEAITATEKAQCAVLIQQLKHSVEDLMEQYLSRHWHTLSDLVRTQVSADFDPETEQEDKVAVRFTAVYERTALHFREVFPMAKGEKRLVDATRELFREYFVSIQSLFAEDSLSTPNHQLSVASNSKLSTVLKRLSNNVRFVHSLLPAAKLTDWAAQSVASSVSEYTMRSFLQLRIRVTGVLESLGQAPPPPAPSLSPLRTPPSAAPSAPHLLLQSALESSHRTLVQGTLMLLKDVGRLLESCAWVVGEWRRELIMLLHTELYTLFCSLLQTFSTMAQEAVQSVSSGSSSSVSVLLLLSRLCQLMEQTALPRLRHVLIGTAFNISTQSSSLAEQEMDSMEAQIHLSAVAAQDYYTDSADSRPDMEALAKDLLDMAKDLLQKYVDCQVLQLSDIIHTNMAAQEWLNCPEPTGALPLVSLLLDRVRSLEDEVEQLLPPGADRPLTFHQSAALSADAGGRSSAEAFSKSQSVSAAIAGSAGSRAARTLSVLLERDMAKLFAQKLELTSKLDFSQSWVVGQCVLLCCKSLLESVREQTFGTAGWMQLQLDTALLRSALVSYVDPNTTASHLSRLLDEVCVAAAERCLDPSPSPAQIALVNGLLQSSQA